MDAMAEFNLQVEFCFSICRIENLGEVEIPMRWRTVWFYMCRDMRDGESEDRIQYRKRKTAG